MKNIINLDPEYWYSLGFAARDLGYKSRQELVATILQTWVRSQPELLERGIARVELDKEAEQLVRKDPRKIEAVKVDPRGVPEDFRPKLKFRFYLQDGSTVEGVGAKPGLALAQVEGRMLSPEEYKAKYRGYEVLD